MQENPRRTEEETYAPEHENAKRRIEAVLERELAQEAERTSDQEINEVAAVARDMKSRVMAGISDSERVEETNRKLARTYQFIDYIFYVSYALIGLLIGLELLGARDRAGFMKFMHTITAPLVAPFKGLMPDPAVGSFQLMMSYIIAIIVYALVHKGIKRFFEILAHREPARM